MPEHVRAGIFFPKTKDELKKHHIRENMIPMLYKKIHEIHNNKESDFRMKFQMILFRHPTLPHINLPSSKLR